MPGPDCTMVNFKCRFCGEHDVSLGICCHEDQRCHTERLFPMGRQRRHECQAADQQTPVFCRECGGRLENGACPRAEDDQSHVVSWLKRQNWCPDSYRDA